MNSDNLFIHTPSARLFFMAAAPGPLSMLASSMYQVIDGMAVGNLAGETAFAAINLGMPFVFINFALADLIGVGASVPMAVSPGKGDNQRASGIFSAACALIILTGLLSGVLMWMFAPTLIALMGAKGPSPKWPSTTSASTRRFLPQPP